MGRDESGSIDSRPGVLFFDPVVLLTIGAVVAGAAYLPLTLLQAQGIGMLLITGAIAWRGRARRRASVSVQPRSVGLHVVRDRLRLPIDDDGVVVDLRDSVRPDLKIVR